jgi:hypothetical protein
MALILVTNPPTVPTLVSNWTDFVARENAALVGTGTDLQIFTLKSWDATTTKPTVAKGSIVEAGGSLYQADSDTALTDDSGLADGTVHIKLVPSSGGASVVPTITNDSLPTWDGEKAGWYDSDDKFLPHEMTRASSGSSFTNKFEYKFLQSAIVKVYANGAVYFPGAGDFGGSGSFAGGLSVGGNLGITGAITAVTNITASGDISCDDITCDVISGTSATLTGDISCDDIDCDRIICDNVSASSYLNTSGNVVCSAINTGAGLVDCYAMDQDLKTTNSPTFAKVTSGSIAFSGTFSTGTFTVSAGTTYTIPAGIYTFSSLIDVGSYLIVDGTIIGGSKTFTGGCSVISDGVNVKISNGTGSSQLVRYLKMT